jgi:hypothetical protein
MDLYTILSEIRLDDTLLAAFPFDNFRSNTFVIEGSDECTTINQLLSKLEVSISTMFKITSLEFSTPGLNKITTSFKVLAISLKCTAELIYIIKNSYHYFLRETRIAHRIS